ncbi:MAG: phospho-sugar mutase [Actinobacteria bacterium]|nr:phospho-sugar mutase [Actinomycetota bacterium]
MMNESLRLEVEKWIEEDPDPKTREQLTRWLNEDNESELRSCFSGFLEFGTAGLRGALGPGPSRMNRAVVSKTAAGLVTFMKRHGLNSIVVGRDARYGSEDFTRAYNGSQIIAPTDKEISEAIAASAPLPTLSRGSAWQTLDDSILNEYVSTTSALAKNPKPLTIVYTAMHGVGLETIEKVFSSAGFAPLVLVKEQAKPDPDFPTVKFPNPEEPGAIDLALAYAKESHADVVIANDPDADRCAGAILDGGVWRMLRGDEVGALLGEYIARRGVNNGVFANSIVSSSILRKIAERYGIAFTETLTGFKYLSKVDNLRFGYEEALGYCVSPRDVNDKDGISAALVLAQMTADLKDQGKTLADFLDEIWRDYGFHGTRQISIRTSSVEQIQAIMTMMRSSMPGQIADRKVMSVDDLSQPKDDLPPTDGIRFYLEGPVRVIVRPSGTEPKVKCYLEVVTSTHSEANLILDQVESAMKKLLIR